MPPMKGGSMRTLREWRIARLYSIRRLASEAKLSPRTIQEAEAGRRQPSLETMRKLSEVLEVEPGEVAEFKTAMDTMSKRDD